MNRNNDEGRWFADLLMKFAPGTVEATGKTPDELASAASWQAFWISTAAALPQGRLGLATIVPELMAVTKIQIDLIHSIAAYHGMKGKLDPALVLMVFANEAEMEIGGKIGTDLGTKLVVKAVGARTLRTMAQKVGSRIDARLSQKTAGRLLPVLLAPVFGAFSKTMTIRIGEEADRLFSREVEVSEPVLCPNGHETFPESRFCPECGCRMPQP